MPQTYAEASAILTDRDYLPLARRLFDELNVLPLDRNEDAAVKLLREVYDRGRIRGIFEAENE